jgi:putative transposase
VSETVRTTYKEKLKPTPEQARALDVVLWRCRTLYNVALEQRKTAWERCHISVKRFAQEAELADIRAEFPAFAAIHSHVLQDVLARLDKAYQAFFRRVQAGEKPGYPRFQGRNRYHSFTYKEHGNGATLEKGGGDLPPPVGDHDTQDSNQARVDNGDLVLSKIGRLAVRWSHPIQGTIKTVTISKEADGWYVCFSCVDVPVQPLPLTGRETGIDVGLKVFLMTAEGERVENPRHYRRAEHELQKVQRQVARRKKGSKRRKKATQVLARKHQKVRRQRTDFHHKTALALVREYDTIYLEDLQVANLSRRPEPKPDGNGGYLPNGASAKAGLNKSISDAGWYRFRQILTCKAECAGKRVVAVPPSYTSQDCSGCGERVEKSLSVRTHVCPFCGLILDRDENAARNIQWAGQALRGLAAEAVGLNREEPMRL